MAIDVLFSNLQRTHGVLQINAWDGPNYYVKDFATCKLSGKTKSLEEIRKTFLEKFGIIANDTTVQAISEDTWNIE